MERMGCKFKRIDADLTVRRDYDVLESAHHQNQHHSSRRCSGFCELTRWCWTTIFKCNYWRINVSGDTVRLTDDLPPTHDPCFRWLKQFLLNFVKFFS